jgi:hypothetical protein
MKLRPFLGLAAFGAALVFSVGPARATSATLAQPAGPLRSGVPTVSFAAAGLRPGVPTVSFAAAGLRPGVPTTPGVNPEQHLQLDQPAASSSEPTDQPTLIFQLGAIATGASGAVDFKLYRDVYAGLAGFIKIDEEAYGFVGGRLSYRLRFEDVTIAPFAGLGHLEGGSMSNEYGGFRVTQPISFYGGAQASIAFGHFALGVEGSAVPARVLVTDGIYEANRQPAYERVEIVPVVGAFAAFRL